MYSVIDHWHGSNEADLTVGDLSNLVFATVSKDHSFYTSVLNNLASHDSGDATSMELLSTLVKRRKLKELSLAAYECSEGRLPADNFDALVASFKALPEGPVADTDDDEFVTDDLQELLDAAVSTPGLRWRLNTLNKMMGSLRKGNFGFVFARPETGKTTFLASEVTFMATQLKDGDGPIIWLANEEPGVNVKLRVYQAYFGIDLPTLMSDIAGWSKKFNEETKGNIKILDRAIIHRTAVEKLCAKWKPSLVIADQLDKITGFDNEREDLRLGSIYQWARELAKQYCPFIGISQADGSGEGVKWLTMGNVANAKTAKQAEADFILGIGKQNADGYESIRYLHLSKNKLLGDSDTDPSMRHGKQECLIEPALGRYKDLY